MFIQSIYDFGDVFGIGFATLEHVRTTAPWFSDVRLFIVGGNNRDRHWAPLDAQSVV